MAILESLIIELGIDVSKLNKGQRDALDTIAKFETEVTRSGKNIEAAQQKVVDMFDTVRKSVVLGIGAIAGGFTAEKALAYITSMESMDAATGRLAYTMGASAKELATWQVALKTVGGSAESANSAIDGLGSAAKRFDLTGQGGEFLGVLNQLHVSLYNGNHELKTGVELWKEIGAAVNGMDPRDAQTFLEMIPGANRDMINFIMLGTKAMNERLAAAAKISNVTKESTEAALAYSTALSQLESSAESLGRTLVTALVGPLTKIMDSMKWFVNLLNTNPQSSEGEEINKKYNKSTFNKLGTPSSMWRAMGFSTGDNKWVGHVNTEEEDLAEFNASQKEDEERTQKARRSEIATPAADSAAARNAKVGDGDKTGEGRQTGGWWTLDRQSHAVQRLMTEGGLTELGARSLVARMMGEAPSGPSSVNPNSGAYGINQSLGTRKPPMVAAGNDFDRQLGVVIHELNSSEAASARALNRATNNEEGAAAAGLNERAGPDEPMMQRDTVRRLPNVPGASLAPGVINNDQSRRGDDVKHTSVTVGDVHVHAPGVTDAAGVAKEIGPELDRTMAAAAFNYGQA